MAVSAATTSSWLRATNSARALIVLAAFAENPLGMRISAPEPVPWR